MVRIHNSAFTLKMSPIKDLNLILEALNKEKTFSEGDTVAGAVTFALTKDTKVKSFLVKLKGDADVRWTEGSGDDERTYSAHRRYFKLKEHLVAESSKGTVLPHGVHRFKFRLTIPPGEMPSSFRGSHGKIVYKLEAKISRSWRWPSSIETELNFVSKSLSHHSQCAQTGSVGKEVGVFSKGQIQMSATVNRKVCSPGDTLSVVATICNSSSKTLRPKFSFNRQQVYRADGSTNSRDKTLCKVVGDPLTTNAEETISCQMKIPDDVIPTLQNCDIIAVSYYLKVYLDIKFAFDPEIVFPLVVIPSSFANSQLGEDMGPYPGGAAGAPSYSDFPPPAFPSGPYPGPAAPGAYGYPPTNPYQQPYSFPNAAFPPPSVQHPSPTAPPLFLQEQQPPTYASLYHPSQDTNKKN